MLRFSKAGPISKCKSFTLVELLTAIAIIAALLTVALFYIGGYIETSQIQSNKRTLTILNDALSRYKCEGGDINALTSGAPISHVLNKLQNTLDWNGLKHSVLQRGKTYSALSISSKGELKQYRFTRFDRYTEEDGGTSPEETGATVSHVMISGGEETNLYAYSYDGVNWQEGSMPITTIWHGVAYGNGRFVATAWGKKCAYSDDCLTWTIVDLPAYADNNIIFANGKFLAGCSDSIIYSTDGEHWTRVMMPYDGNFMRAFYANGEFIVLGNPNLIYSTDCENWTEVGPLDLSDFGWHLAYGNGVYVAVGQFAKECSYSSDRVNWTNVQLPPSYEWSYCRGFFFHNGYFKIITDQGYIGLSSEGHNWSWVPHDEKVGFTLNESGNFYTHINNGRFYTSSDFENWTELILPEDFYYTDIAIRQ